MKTKKKKAPKSASGETLAVDYGPGSGYCPQAEGCTWARAAGLGAAAYAQLLGVDALSANDAIYGRVLKRTHEIHRIIVAAYADGRLWRQSDLAQAGVRAPSPHMASLRADQLIAPATIGEKGEIAYAYHTADTIRGTACRAGDVNCDAAGREYALTPLALSRIRANGGLVSGDGLLCAAVKTKTAAKRRK